MSWTQLTLKTNQAFVDEISEHLTNVGAVSVTLQDAKNQPILEPQPGETPLWEDIILTALFESTANPLSIQLELLKTYDAKQIGEAKFETVEDQNWERAWLDHFHPMQFGQRLWICPTTQSPPNPEAINIMLDPGLAFGTGTHPTTALCLEWLDEHVQPRQTLLDYGCGSGILAIAALKLGCKYALAIDNDPQALIATEENARRNKIDLNQLDVQLSAQAEKKSTKLIQPDLLVANILATPLLELAPKLVALLRPGSKIALSGILNDQAASVHDAYQALGVKFNSMKNKEEWIILEGFLD